MSMAEIFTLKILNDDSLCRDCQACTLACSLYHAGECNPSVARLQVSKDMARYAFEIVICRQCEDPDCIAACPNESIRIDEFGRACCMKTNACSAARAQKPARITLSFTMMLQDSTSSAICVPGAKAGRLACSSARWVR